MRRALLSLAAIVLPIVGAQEVNNARAFCNNGGTYSWLRFEVVNSRPEPRLFSLFVGNSHGSEHSVQLPGQRLEPGERRLYQLAVPTFGIAGSLGIALDGPDGRTRSGANVAREARFLQIAPVGAWSSEQQMIDFCTGTTAGPGYPAYRSGSKTTTHNVEQIDPADRLPDNWLCYLPFWGIFVEESSWNRLEPSQKSALLDWVGSGGRLVVYGSDEYREERRLLGSIVHRRESPLADSASAGAWNGLAVDSFRNSASGPVQSDFPFFSKGYAARSGGLILATLFLIVAGPINFMYWRRRNRIRMLIVSVPVLSLSFCLLMGVFFVASQGFARKGGSFSVTLVDEANDQGFTFSRHAMLSGLYPLGGFGFDARTCFYPLADPGWNDAYSFSGADGQRLVSGLFKPSVNFHYFTARPFQTRERVEYNPAARTVRNAYESGFSNLLLRDGEHYLWAKSVPSGGEVKLEDLSPGVAMGWPAPFTGRVMSEKELTYWNHLRAFWQPMVDNNRGPAYMARLDQNPAGLEQGASIRSGRQCNIVIGLLEPPGS